MKDTIIFIHGMFQNPRSWENWVNYFAAKGYVCKAPAWPLHEGEPAELRQNPPKDLGELRLAAIIEKFRDIVAAETEKPILIGHSVGGLVAQVLVNEGLAKMGVAISSVAPNDIISFDWSFFKNSLSITNPLKGNDPFLMNLETFHKAFSSPMSLEETRPLYERYATHDSRNVLRDCLGKSGRVDIEAPHVPLLFIAGEEDQLIPDDLDDKNARAYTDDSSITDYHKFEGRGHFICAQPGWEEVASYVSNWLERVQTLETVSR